MFNTEDIVKVVVVFYCSSAEACFFNVTFTCMIRQNTGKSYMMQSVQLLYLNKSIILFKFPRGVIHSDFFHE